MHLKLVFVLDSYLGFILVKLSLTMEGINQQIFTLLAITSPDFLISEVF